MCKECSEENCRLFFVHLLSSFVRLLLSSLFCLEMFQVVLRWSQDNTPAVSCWFPHRKLGKWWQKGNLFSFHLYRFVPISCSLNTFCCSIFVSLHLSFIVCSRFLLFLCFSSPPRPLEIPLQLKLNLSSPSSSSSPIPRQMEEEAKWYF